jgi:O-antigen ligase
LKLIPKKLTHFGLLLFASTLAISHVPAQFGIAFAFLGWLLEGIVNKNWQFRKDMFLVVLATYVAWNMVCSALSPRPLHSMMAVVDNEWPAMLMVMMFWTLHDVKVLRRILLGIMISGAFAMVYALWQVFAGIELYRGMALDPDPSGRFFRSVGFYGFYLTFAALAMTVCFVSASYVLEVRTKRRWLWSVIPVLSFLAVLATFARSVWFSFAGIVPLLGFLRGKKKDLIVTAIVILAALAAITTIPPLRERVLSSFDPKQNETRINLWKTSLNMSKDFRIVGFGQDNFDYFFERYKVDGFYDTTVHPHNDYLNVLVNAGIPGLVMFLMLWGLALKKGMETWRTSADEVARAAALGGVLSLGGLLIGGLFQDYYGTFANCLGWWLVVGLIFAAGNMTKLSGPGANG